MRDITGLFGVFTIAAIVTAVLLFGAEKITHRRPMVQPEFTSATASTNAETSGSGLPPGYTVVTDGRQFTTKDGNYISCFRFDTASEATNYAWNTFWRERDRELHPWKEVK